MSTVYHCDRCDKTSERRDDIVQQDFMIVKPYTHERQEIYKDLCHSCLMNLHEFLQPLPKPAPKEIHGEARTR